MGPINIRRHYSRNTLFRMLLMAAVAAALIVWKWNLVNDVYFRNQLTQLGWAINGAILVLFGVGLLRLVVSLLGYMREESALLRFVHNLENRLDDPLLGVNQGSLIEQRFVTLRQLHEARTPINQSALAATLVASESTRNSMAKFVNNILILTGVFGTIVSLSVALLGASNILDNAVNAGGMGMMIHGMSTALSTTITAIVCYVYFGYFYMRVTDAQTNLVSGIEQVTTLSLMPKYQVQTENALYEFTGLVRSLQGLVTEMHDSQQSFRDTQTAIRQTLEAYRDQADELDRHLADIVRQLRLGFRLRDEE